MIFNSFSFIIFLVVVVSIYWKTSYIVQNRLLLAASYFFYSMWDWRFLSLILISTVVDFISGIQIEKNSQTNNTKEKKKWLILSICTNLGLLGIFKYYNFFIESLSELVLNFGMNAEMLHLNIILPVGISFYTFQTMSYTIDIYKGKLKPTNRFFDFALFVTFFPQLVAGPIERAKSLLPQILNHRVFSKDQFIDGINLILWGLFKKVYVADNLAIYVDHIFSKPNQTSFEIICSSWAFAFQIYADFSAYSDIARGCAKCLGIELRLNFNLPYISQNPQEFWQRWHISLSSWLRDYLYFSLGGSKRGSFITYRNLLLTMIIGGLWHGAAWNFVVWGAYQGAILVIHRLFTQSWLASQIIISTPIWQNLIKALKIIFFFQVVCYGWLLFRAESLSQISTMTSTLVSNTLIYSYSDMKPLIIFALPLIFGEFIYHTYYKNRAHLVNGFNMTKAALIYPVLAFYFYLFTFHGASAQGFIYFQF